MLSLLNKEAKQSLGRIYSGKYWLRGKERVENDISESCLGKYNSQREYQYYFYMFLREQSINGYIPQQQLFDVMRERAGKILSVQDSLSVRILIDYGLENKVNLSDSVNINNLSIWTRVRVKNEEQQRNVINFINNLLEKQVHSITSGQFLDIVQAIRLLLSKNVCFNQEFVRDIKWTLIQKRLSDFEKQPELIEHEHMPFILNSIVEISQKCGIKFKLNFSFYDRIYTEEFKNLDSDQLCSLFCSLIFFMNTPSRFVEQSYFSLIKNKPFHLKEVLVHKLGINDFSQGVLKLIKTSLTRLILLNSVSKHPKYQKLIQLSVSHKVSIIISLLGSPSFKNSPLIDSYLADLVAIIQESYAYHVGLDFQKEEQMYPLFSSILSVLSLLKIAHSLSQDYILLRGFTLNFFTLHSKFFDIPAHLNMIRLIQNMLVNSSQLTQNQENYQRNHQNSDDAQLKSNSENNQHEKVNQKQYFNQDKVKQYELELNSFETQFPEYRVFLVIFCQRFEVLLNGRLSEVEITNNQEFILPIILLFERFLKQRFQTCLIFFERLSMNIHRLSLQNRIVFIEFLRRNSYSNIQEVNILLSNLIYGEFLPAISNHFELRVRFIILLLEMAKFQNFCKPSEVVNQSFEKPPQRREECSSSQRLTRDESIFFSEDNFIRFIDEQTGELMRQSISDDITESNILLTTELMLASQNILLSKSEIIKLQDVFFRIISDKHSNFSIECYQKIISNCLSLHNVHKNFDDGSGCYNLTLLEELRQFNIQHFSSFSPSFQILIQPFVPQEESLLTSYSNICHEVISSKLK